MGVGRAPHAHTTRSKEGWTSSHTDNTIPSYNTRSSSSMRIPAPPSTITTTIIQRQMHWRRGWPALISTSLSKGQNQADSGLSQSEYHT